MLHNTYMHRDSSVNILLIFPFLQTNITVQMRPGEGLGENSAVMVMTHTRQWEYTQC